MEKFWYLIGGMLFGFLIFYLIFKGKIEGEAAFECNQKQHVVQYCLDTLTIDSNSIVNLDETMIQYYSEAFSAGDMIGFSLDKALVLSLAAYLGFDPQSHGVRLYPGLNGNNKLVLIKPLDNNGNERPNLGTIMNVNNIGSGLGGPCPRWCATPGRLIISNSTPLAPSGN